MFSFIHPIIGLRQICLACIVVFGITALVACGGSSGGNGGTDDGETDSEGSSNNTAPTAVITSPADGTIYTYGDTITFTGSGTDSEDGDLSGTSLVWTSDLDGEVGTGDSFTLSDLSWGDHTITITATDSDAESATDNVYISVKAWTHPDDLTDNISPDGDYADSPLVAMDGRGNAVIAWKQSDGSNDQIFKSEYRNGTWTHPDDLTDNISPDGEDVYSLQVAMDGNGNAVITWYQSNGSNDQIFKSEYRNGAWTHPTDLDNNISPDGQSAAAPWVAMDGNGNAIITWEQFDGSNYQIFKSEYRNGAWTHPTDLGDNISPDGQDAYSSRVTMDGNGNAIITWRQSDGSNYQIFKSEYRNGAWTHPTDLTDNISPDGESAYDPQVAMDGNGNAVVTWQQSDGSNYQIFKSEYRNGAWTHPSGLTDNISPGGGGAAYSQMAMDNSDNAVITWCQSDGSYPQIFMSEYRNGTWTHPADLTDNISPDGGAAYYPHAAMDGNGNAVIAWMQLDGSYYQIFKSEYRNGTWTHPAGITDNISPDEEDAEYPQVAMDESGNAIITWRQSDGSNYQIFMSEYY